MCRLRRDVRNSYPDQFATGAMTLYQFIGKRTVSDGTTRTVLDPASNPDNKRLW